MYQRFKTGLLQPKMIPAFIKDSWLRIWSYFFLLMVIMSIPYLVIVLPFNGLRGDEVTAMEESYLSNFYGPYKIENGILVIPDENLSDRKYVMIDNYTISLINRPTDLQSRMFEYVFTTNGIRFNSLFEEAGFYEYAELGLTNYSFEDYSNQNIEKFVSAINYIRTKHDSEFKIVQTVLYILSNAIQTLFFILLAAFLNRVPVPFKIKLKVIFYAVTIFVVCNLAALLFGFEAFVYIGMILLIIYSNLALSQFVVN